ncbi:hypothetical protein [Clostridium sp. LP20]|uniref:hypothetical protein n=1 Tax=Clostridium sp. LP20 TaxID=3418665 RepID=UPI003EE708F2
MERLNNVRFTYKGCTNINISENENKLCYFYSLKTTRRIKKTVNHHILLIDVSCSMYNELPRLKEKLKETLDVLSNTKNNYISIITFSGHNDSLRIINAVKCDKTSYAMAQVYKKVEDEIFTKGVTIMSEPLEDAIEIVKSLTDICNKHHIILFTDGCLVPMEWSYNDEEDKCYKVGYLCKNSNVYLNTVGFGQYYDREFLENLISIPNNGKFIHIDDVSDYQDTALKMISTINNTDSTDIKINNEDFFLVNSSQRISTTHTIKNLSSSTDNLIVTFDDPLNIENIDIKINNRCPTQSVIEDFLYSLSLNHLLNGDIDSCEITLSQTGDIYVYKLLSNCYSFLEKGKAITYLNKVITDKTERFKEGKEEIKVLPATNEPICLLEVLNEILADENSKLLWDYKYPYKRIGIKNILDEYRYKFTYDKTGYGNVIDINIGSKKLNIGVKVEINGEVNDLVSKLKLDAKMYKEYNLIVNGNINTSELPCILSRKLKIKYKKEGILKKSIKWNDKVISIMDLTKIKTTNKRLLRSLSSETIASYLYDIQVLGCKQWALNKHIKSLLISTNGEDIDLSNISSEERDARVTFKVNDKGIFTPKSLLKDDTSPYEIYPAKFIEWKIEKFPKKKEEESAYENYGELITSDSKNSYSLLLSELKKVKEEKLKKQRLLNSVRISSGLIGKPVIKWDNEYEKVKREYNKTLDRNMIINDSVVISTKSIGNISIRQDLYTVLTKSN